MSFVGVDKKNESATAIPARTVLKGGWYLDWYEGYEQFWRGSKALIQCNAKSFKNQDVGSLDLSFLYTYVLKEIS